MSMSEWDFTHALADYKNFRQSSRDRLLFEMLRSAEKGDSANDPRSTWKILIMDKVTLKVMSFSCKMADITDQAISCGFSHCPFITKKENFQPIEKATDGTVVEDIVKRREPLPSMDAIYFMQPTKENMLWFLSDMSGRCPLYRKAYVFFSSPIPRELTAYIKNDASVIPRIGALREMNLEYFAIDSQAFITDHDMALEELFGDNAENSRKYIECVSTMAIRIATAFASLKELPYVRYRAAKSDTRTAQDLVPSRLAAAVWEILSKYKSSVPDFPQKETCDLLIVDRSVDQIAPVIHEWTYDAMIHDLLEMDGNKYIYEAPGKMGAAPERKEALLDDNDPVWLELRHAHIADASERLHEKMSSFVSKNKAAQLQTNSRDGGEISTRDLQKLVQALPQYQEQVEKLSLHVEIAGKINTMIKENGLRSLGQLEQDLVFGDAGAKEMISFLRANQGMSAENKLRLLMIYSTTHPEKFEGDKGLQLMQLAKLSSEDMKVINNMMYLGKMSTKKSRENFSLKFDTQKKKQAARQEKSDEEETWALSRFYPMVEELIEKLSKGELPRNDYPYINEPTATSPSGGPLAASNRTPGSQPAQSIRSRRTATWAKGRNSDDGCSSDSVLKNASLDLKKMGQRIFLFIIGGATRSELRTIHKLTPKLKREVILGTSIIDDPSMFITKLKTLTRKDVPQQKLQI